MDWTDELIALFAAAGGAPHPRLARHIHMPLQSGSLAVLRRMRRRYRPSDYARRLERLHRAVPDAAFGADVMVGFPGETEAEFEETRAFIAGLPLTYLHVFPYSGRPETESAERAGAAGWAEVPAPAAAERRHRLLELMAERQAKALAAWTARRLSVITLQGGGPTPHGTWSLSDNYLRVWLEGRAQEPNRILEVTVIGHDGRNLRAEAAA